MRTNRTRIAQLLGAGLIMALCSASAAAGLSALLYEESSGSLLAAQVGSADGEVALGSESVSDCCLVGAGMTAVDAQGERFFAFGLYSGGNLVGAPVLLTLSFDGGATAEVSPAESPQVLLAYDSAMDRLISVTQTGPPNATTQWLSIDYATGATTPIGGELTDCCEIATGLASVSPGDQRLFFVGRDFGASDWQVMSVDLANGAVSSIATLPTGRPGFLVFDGDSGMIDLLMQTAPADPSGLYRVDPVGGNVTLIATQPDTDCCLVATGDVASRDETGEFWWIGGSGSGLTPSPGFFALHASQDFEAAATEQLTTDYRLHAMVVRGVVINPDILFQDRFEL